MKFSINKQTVFLLTVIITVASSIPGKQPQAKAKPARDANQLLIVDCMLPGKIRRLGGGARYQTARRPIKTSGADCEIRGGEYVAYDRANYATALKVWLPQAKAGDPKAQTYVGEMFEKGLGTTPDCTTALSWYMKAAEQGYDRAQMNIGAIYEQGLGVEKDEVAALNWYRKATGLGDDDLTFASNLDELEAETEGLRQTVAERDAEILQLNQNLRSSRARVDAQVAELSKSTRELEQMRFRAGKANVSVSGADEIAELNRQIQQKESQLAAQQQEAQSMRIALDQQQADFANRLDSEQGTKESFQAELDQQNETIAKLEKQNTELASELDQRHSDLEVAELNRQIQQKESQLAAQRQEVQSMRIALDQQQVDFANRLVNEQGANESFQALLDQQNETITRLEKQTAELTSELGQRQSDLEKESRQMEALREDLKIARDNSDETEEIARLSETILKQQVELEQRTHNISYLEKELSIQNQQIKSEKEQFEKQEQQWREDVDIALLQQQSIQERLENNESQLEAAQNELSQNNTLIAQQRIELEQKESELEEQQQQFTSTQQASDQQSRIRTAELENQLFDRGIELAQSEGQNTALRTEIDVIRLELDRLRALKAGLSSSDTIAMRGASPAPPVAAPNPAIPKVEFGKYFALIIGNNEYPNFPDLKTPRNDVEDLAKILRTQYRFKTEVLVNADRYTILQALNKYREKLTDKDNFLLYYAGHGELDRNSNRGHWLPVDAVPNDQTNWISNIQITDLINSMNAKHVMVIADSCYSGTLTHNLKIPQMASETMATRSGANSTGQRKPDRYYEIFTVKRSRTAMTSGGTKPVLDGGGGEHSIFANHLLSTLEGNQGVLEGWMLYDKVSRGVNVTASSLNVDQVPEFAEIKNAGHTGAPFFFVSS